MVEGEKAFESADDTHRERERIEASSVFQELLYEIPAVTETEKAEAREKVYDFLRNLPERIKNLKEPRIGVLHSSALQEKDLETTQVEHALREAYLEFNKVTDVSDEELDTFVIVLDEHAVFDKDLVESVRTALEQGKKVIPIRPNSNIFLNDVPIEDLTDDPERIAHDAVRQELQALIGGQSVLEMFDIDPPSERKGAEMGNMRDASLAARRALIRAVNPRYAQYKYAQRIDYLRRDYSVAANVGEQIIHEHLGIEPLDIHEATARELQKGSVLDAKVSMLTYEFLRSLRSKEQMKIPQIFFSHSRLDFHKPLPGQEAVAYRMRQLAEYLTHRDYGRNNIDLWRDITNVPPGEDFEAEIERTIKECTSVMLVLSSRSLRSRWVRVEVELAAQVGKPIMPIRVEENINLTNERDDGETDQQYGNRQRIIQVLRSEDILDEVDMTHIEDPRETARKEIAPETSSLEDVPDKVLKSDRFYHAQKKAEEENGSKLEDTYYRILGTNRELLRQEKAA